MNPLFLEKVREHLPPSAQRARWALGVGGLGEDLVYFNWADQVIQVTQKMGDFYVYLKPETKHLMGVLGLGLDPGHSYVACYFCDTYKRDVADIRLYLMIRNHLGFGEIIDLAWVGSLPVPLGYLSFKLWASLIEANQDVFPEETLFLFKNLILKKARKRIQLLKEDRVIL